MIKQGALAPSNIANYQSMLEATDFSIFKREFINESMILCRPTASFALTRVALWKQYMFQPQNFIAPSKSPATQERALFQDWPEATS